MSEDQNIRPEQGEHIYSWLPLEAPSIDNEEVWKEDLRRWNQHHQKTYQVLWHVDINPLPQMWNFPNPMCIGVQTTNDPRYLAEGRLRSWEEYFYFCYTLSGRGAFADGKGVHYVSEGDAFLVEISDSATSYFYPEDDKSPWTFLAVNFRGLAAQALVRDMVANYGAIYSLSRTSPIIMRLLEFESFSFKTIHPHALDCAEIILELLLALAASARAREDTDLGMGLIKDALAVMNRELENDISVVSIAKSLGVNREHLTRTFQKRLQRSPQDILLEMKIRRASYLLKDTDLFIKEIAARLGYSDYRNFIRVFREAKNMTPSEFRHHGRINLSEPLRLVPRMDKLDKSG